MLLACCNTQVRREVRRPPAACLPPFRQDEVEDLVSVRSASPPPAASANDSSDSSSDDEDSTSSSSSDESSSSEADEAEGRRAAKRRRTRAKHKKKHKKGHRSKKQAKKQKRGGRVKSEAQTPDEQRIWRRIMKLEAPHTPAAVHTYLSNIQLAMQPDSPVPFAEFKRLLNYVATVTGGSKKTRVQVFHRLWKRKVTPFLSATQNASNATWRALAAVHFSSSTREARAEAATQEAMLRKLRQIEKLPLAGGAGAGANQSFTQASRSGAGRRGYREGAGAGASGDQPPERVRGPRGRSSTPYDPHRPSRRGSSRGPPQCYTCGVTGHKAIECQSTLPPRCRKCGAADHHTDACTRL